MGVSLVNHFWIFIPPELVLNKENVDDRRTTFLDLLIEIFGDHFIYKLYDKRDAFPFHIVRFPFKCSNLYLLRCFITRLVLRYYALVELPFPMETSWHPLNLS